MVGEEEEQQQQQCSHQCSTLLLMKVDGLERTDSRCRGRSSEHGANSSKRRRQLGFALLSLSLSRSTRSGSSAIMSASVNK